MNKAACNTGACKGDFTAYYTLVPVTAAVTALSDREDSLFNSLIVSLRRGQGVRKVFMIPDDAAGAQAGAPYSGSPYTCALYIAGLYHLYCSSEQNLNLERYRED